jgi:hypothetical protein
MLPISRTTDVFNVFVFMVSSLLVYLTAERIRSNVIRSWFIPCQNERLPSDGQKLKAKNRFRISKINCERDVPDHKKSIAHSVHVSIDGRYFFRLFSVIVNDKLLCRHRAYVMQARNLFFYGWLMASPGYPTQPKLAMLQTEYPP